MRNTSEYNDVLKGMIGLTKEEFEKKFRAYPIFRGVKLQFISKGSKVNFDFHFERVQPYVNENGIVERAEIG